MRRITIRRIQHLSYEGNIVITIQIFEKEFHLTQIVTFCKKKDPAICKQLKILITIDCA